MAGTAAAMHFPAAGRGNGKIGRPAPFLAALLRA